MMPLALDPVSGRPRIVVADGVKRLYDRLEDTNGALKVEDDPIEDVESEELEHLIYECSGQVVHGWSPDHWNSYKVVGQPRKSRRGGSTFNPTHLGYSISNDQTVYAVRRACLRDEWDEVVYPFSLSNLMGITCRRHNISARSLKHLVFYNITNAKAWSAMASAFQAKSVTLPQHPRRSLSEDELLSKETAWRMPGSGRKTMLRYQLRPVSITINKTEHGDAWMALHSGNPFTRAAQRLLHDEINSAETRLVITAYTLIAVAQSCSFGPQGYWNALVAHLEPFGPQDEKVS